MTFTCDSHIYQSVTLWKKPLLSVHNRPDQSHRRFRLVYNVRMILGQAEFSANDHDDNIKILRENDKGTETRNVKGIHFYVLKTQVICVTLYLSGWCIDTLQVDDRSFNVRTHKRPTDTNPLQSAPPNNTVKQLACAWPCRMRDAMLAEYAAKIVYQRLNCVASIIPDYR